MFLTHQYINFTFLRLSRQHLLYGVADALGAGYQPPADKNQKTLKKISPAGL